MEMTNDEIVVRYRQAKEKGKRSGIHEKNFYK